MSSPVLTRTLIAALHFFLCMTTYYIMKPVREALFVHSVGFNSLPIVHLLVAAATYLAAQLFDALARRYRPGALAANSTITFLAGLLLMWIALRAIPLDSPLHKALPWAYYLGVSLYVVFVVTLFWSLTHTAFTTEEGKKYYGWIGSGGILGGLAGSFLTQKIVPIVGTENLLAVAALTLAPCLLTGRWLDSQRKDSGTKAPTEKPKPAWSLLLSQRYLAGIGALVVFTLAMEELGDHQTHRLLGMSGMSKNQLTQFWSHLYSITNASGAALNLLIAGALQVRYGPLPGLLFLQISSIVKTVLVYHYPTPDMITWTLAPELALHYSLFQAAKELLYTPCDPDVKYRAKTLIETFLFRAGISIAAISVLIYFRHLEDMGQLVAFAGLFSIFNIALSIWLTRQYRHQLSLAKQTPS